MNVIQKLLTMILLMVGFLLVPNLAESKPSVTSPNTVRDAYTVVVKFDSSTEDGDAIPVRGVCAVKVPSFGVSGTVALYQVATATTSASSGTLVGSFAAQTTSPTIFKPGLSYVRPVATVASDGTRMEIHCSNVQVTTAEQDFFNVMDYGAVADGTTDDSAAANAASAAAAAAGGGIVYFPKGTYCLGETGSVRVFSGLRITSDNTHVRGDGPGVTTLRPCGDNGNYAVIFCANAINSSCATNKSFQSAPSGNPVSINTTAGHNLSDGDTVYIVGNSMTQINNIFHTVDVDDADTFTLRGVNGSSYTTGNTTGNIFTKAAILKDTSIADLTIEDPDTLGASGHANYEIFSQTNLSGGPPARYNDVSWNSGTENGTIAWYDAATGRIAVVPDAQVEGGPVNQIAVDDVITDGSWTATATAVVARTTEESHGTGGKFLLRHSAKNVYAKDIADESFDYFESEGVMLKDNHATGCSKEDAGGSCVSFSGSTRSSVIGGTYSGGQDSIGASGAIVAISANTFTPLEGISLVGVHLFEDSTATADIIEGGISVNANSANILGTLMTGSTVDVEFDDIEAVTTTGSGKISEINVVNSRVFGRVFGSATDHKISLMNSVVSNSVQDSGSCVAGVNLIKGGSISCTNANAPQVAFAVNRATSVLDGVDVTATNTCLGVSSVAARIENNNFDCGNGSGFDFVVQELSGSSNTIFQSNYITQFSSQHATKPVRIGQISGTVADGSTVNTSSVSFVDQVCTDANADGNCDDNTAVLKKEAVEVTNRGDLDPAS